MQYYFVGWRLSIPTITWRRGLHADFSGVEAPN